MQSLAESADFLMAPCSREWNENTDTAFRDFFFIGPKWLKFWQYNELAGKKRKKFVLFFCVWERVFLRSALFLGAWVTYSKVQDFLFPQTVLILSYMFLASCHFIVKFQIKRTIFSLSQLFSSMSVCFSQTSLHQTDPFYQGSVGKISVFTSALFGFPLLCAHVSSNITFHYFLFQFFNCYADDTQL